MHIVPFRGSEPEKKELTPEEKERARKEELASYARSTVRLYGVSARKRARLSQAFWAMK